MKRKSASIAFVRSKPIQLSFFLRSFVLILFGVVVASAQTSADELIKRGKELLAQKQYYEASKIFDAAVKADPASAEAYCFRGKLQLDREKGNDDLSKAIELKPDYAEAYYERGLNKDLANDQVSALCRTTQFNAHCDTQNYNLVPYCVLQFV